MADDPRNRSKLALSHVIPAPVRARELRASSTVPDFRPTTPVKLDAASFRHLGPSSSASASVSLCRTPKPFCVLLRCST
ncbi:hypothetical protein MES4922_250100 [Mesorhizobium ventifaucium]|uniref:Uncharacterized protein n=1 Tax=Mesorhizobium ventifaucium TaxID=666020 RepID=A0ABN8JUG0_9HYPH|nr:hypothetical protein MES4922_250100 [Mesorhizobium ventifaucium]